MTGSIIEHSQGLKLAGPIRPLYTKHLWDVSWDTDVDADALVEAPMPAEAACIEAFESLNTRPGFAEARLA